MSHITKVMTGLAMIGDIVSFNNVAIIPFFLAGDLDQDLLPAIYFSTHKKHNEEACKTDPTSLEVLKRMKDHVRSGINRIFQEAEFQAQQEKMLNIQKVRDELQSRNDPHPQGTVAEIAAKFGISKSEVRRMKQDGTLDAFLASKQA